jgi:hypothetical protein
MLLARLAVIVHLGSSPHCTVVIQPGSLPDCTALWMLLARLAVIVQLGSSPHCTVVIQLGSLPDCTALWMLLARLAVIVHLGSSPHCTVVIQLGSLPDCTALWMLLARLAVIVHLRSSPHYTVERLLGSPFSSLCPALSSPKYLNNKICIFKSNLFSLWRDLGDGGGERISSFNACTFVAEFGGLEVLKVGVHRSRSLKGTYIHIQYIHTLVTLWATDATVYCMYELQMSTFQLHPLNYAPDLLSYGSYYLSYCRETDVHFWN